MATDHYIEDQRDRVPVDIEVEGRTGEMDFNTLKTGGIIKQRQKDLFTVRLKCPGGRVATDKLAQIAAVARQYGGGYVHLSFRQSIEIPYVDYRNIGKVQKALAPVGQEVASCGPRFRVPTACSGCEYNPNGLADTQAMAERTCQEFFGKGRLAHKFKTSFSGCPIDCARTNEMDLGFQGAVKPVWTEEECIGCRACARACREGAILAHEETGHPLYYPENCLYCGDCIRACPTAAWQAERTGWVVRCGGKHGRHPIHGQVIARFLPDKKVGPLIQAVIAWYEQNGVGKGRRRIGELLLEEAAWRNFLEAVRPVLGEYALPNPPPPRRNEIHFVSPDEGLYGKREARLQLPAGGENREVRIPDAQHVQPEKEADFRGVACPLNYVKTKLVLETLGKGQTLRILLDEEGARNVPASAAADGHKVLAVAPKGDHWEVVLRKEQ